MIIPLFYIQFNNTLPPKPILPESLGGSGRELSCIYKTNENNYTVSCYYSVCRTKCFFYEPELGEVVIHRYEDLILSSSKPLSIQYQKFLLRIKNFWEKKFPDFDLK